MNTPKIKIRYAKLLDPFLKEFMEADFSDPKTIVAILKNEEEILM